MCPDTGMTLCMIAEGDGFRPMTAQEEFATLCATTPGLAPADLSLDDSGLDEMLYQMEHSYGPDFPQMA